MKPRPRPDPADAGGADRGYEKEHDAVVLSGGRASRLGGIDKPGIELGGRQLVEYVAEAVAEARRLVLVGPSRPGLPRAIAARESPPGAGPVPAVAAGITHVEAEWVAVLAADLPFLRGSHVAALLAAAEGRDGAVLVDDTARKQWLIGVWRTNTLRAALRTYHGSSLRGLFDPLNPRPVTVPGEVPPPWLDCDTMGDITSAKEWM